MFMLSHSTQENPILSTFDIHTVENNFKQVTSFQTRILNTPKTTTALTGHIDMKWSDPKNVDI